jgi:hypothetical protein
VLSKLLKQVVPLLRGRGCITFLDNLLVMQLTHNTLENTNSDAATNYGLQDQLGEVCLSKLKVDSTQKTK